MKLGIIGLGQRMTALLHSFWIEEPGLEVAGIVDANPEEARLRLPEEKRETAKIYDTLDQLVSQAKPDALAIGTRCNSHADFALEAAKYDLPLFLEKPIATNISDAIQLEKAFENSRCQVLVSFPLRVSTLCQMAKRHIDKGDIGRVEHLAAFNYVPYGDVYFLTWYRDYSITQGLFLQKATHDFDYLAYLAGAPIVRVAALHSRGRVFRDKKTEGKNPDPFALYAEHIGTPEEGMNEDSSSALLEFANGAQGTYSQVFFAKRDAAKRGATISGFGGTLEFDWYKHEFQCVHHHEPVTERKKVEEGALHFGGDTALAGNFISLVRGDAASAAPMSCGLQSVYACLAAKQSAETHQFVPVRQLGQC